MHSPLFSLSSVVTLSFLAMSLTVQARSPIYDKVMKREVTKIYSSLNNLTLSLLTLNLKDSPGPILSMKADLETVSFRYLKSGLAGFSSCAGRIGDKKSNDTFVGVEEKENCSAISNDRFYQRVHQQVASDAHQEIVQNLSVATTPVFAQALADRMIEKTKTWFELSSIAIALSNYDRQTGLATYSVELNGSEEGAFGVIGFVPTTCTSTLTVGMIQAEGSESPMTSPEAVYGPLICQKNRN